MNVKSEYETVISLCMQYARSHKEASPVSMIIDTDSYFNLMAQCRDRDLMLWAKKDGKRSFYGLEITVIDTEKTVIVVGDFCFKM